MIFKLTSAPIEARIGTSFPFEVIMTELLTDLQTNKKLT